MLLSFFKRKLTPQTQPSALLKADDVFLVSYPRSGNTWLRAIIAYLLYPAENIQTLKDLDDYVPDIYVEIPQHTHYSIPRVIKTHEPFWTRHERETHTLYRQYIYVLRHPYKVLESYYHFEAARTPQTVGNLQTFVDAVLHNAYYYGSWADHIISWQYAQRQAHKTLFVRYEDLAKHPIATIQRTAQFLGHPVDEERATQVKQFSSQENMRELDKRGQIIPGFEMVRAGEQRQMDEKLTDAMKDQIYARYQQVMTDWGYLSDGQVLDDYPLKHHYE